MRILVTGSAGHLGEALVRTLRPRHEVGGLDVKASPYTDLVGSIVDREFVAHCVEGVDAVIHAATLHKPHVATHSWQQFIDVNVTGTLNLLEESAAAGVGAFVYTSTTSAFGAAVVPPPGAPAAWITEDVPSSPKNIYGVSKVAAEDICELTHRQTALPCIVLRTSRFFPEPDDDPAIRRTYSDANSKVNELLHRRVDLEDVVTAHELAVTRAPGIGFDRYVVSATTPFDQSDAEELRTNAPSVIRRRVPAFASVYEQLQWTMFPSIDRVYVNNRARHALGWRPKYDFHSAMERVVAGEDYRSELARVVGSKGYHDREFTDGPYPIT